MQESFFIVICVAILSRSMQARYSRGPVLDLNKNKADGLLPGDVDQPSIRAAELAAEAGFNVVRAWDVGVCTLENIPKLHPPGMNLAPYESWLKLPSPKDEITVAMHTDDACGNMFGSLGPRNKGQRMQFISSFATTWDEFPDVFEFSCEDWQCANLAWLPDPTKLRRHKMTCQPGYYGKMVPYTFDGRDPTLHGQVQRKLAITTK